MKLYAKEVFNKLENEEMELERQREVKRIETLFGLAHDKVLGELRNNFGVTKNVMDMLIEEYMSQHALLFFNFKTKIVRTTDMSVIKNSKMNYFASKQFRPPGSVGKYQLVTVIL